MRIAQISTLYESVPPKAYGGTERVVSRLAGALVEAGHEVTLFATADCVSTRDYLRVYETILGGPSHGHEIHPAASLEGA
jgi:hypothetical protein